MPSPTVVVTDSTACLPVEVAAENAITVVPLHVVIGSETHDEGSPAATPDALAEALRAYRPVSTSRPTPAVFGEVYRRLAEAGAREIVSVHLSGDMSGTVESARAAAREATRDVGVEVVCVDTRQVGVGTGYAALTAARAAHEGASAARAAAAAQRRAEATSSYFYVDTLEYLRRGGRIGAAAALLGGALAVKPLLTIEDGVVGPLERVRTSARAIARLGELAAAAAGDAPIDLTVSHLASPDRAAALVEQLGTRLADNLEGREPWCGELGAVLGAHVGPGMLAVCVSPTG